jgi:hypothetical protein
MTVSVKPLSQFTSAQWRDLAQFALSMAERIEADALVRDLVRDQRHNPVTGFGTAGKSRVSGAISDNSIHPADRPTPGNGTGWQAQQEFSPKRPSQDLHDRLVDAMLGPANRK